jgi:hypothetical protein
MEGILRRCWASETLWPLDALIGVSDLLGDLESNEFPHQRWADRSPPEVNLPGHYLMLHS